MGSSRITSCGSFSRARASPRGGGAGRNGPTRHNNAADDELYSKGPVAADALALPPGVSPAVAARELRKAKNRASALASRLRREGRAAALEGRVRALEGEVRLLERARDDARREAAAKRSGGGALPPPAAAASLAARGGLGARRRSERVMEMRRHLTL